MQFEPGNHFLQALRLAHARFRLCPAALDHAARVLAEEEQRLRVYAVDPGDMRTQMQQDAFPGEDISDRAEPATVVPHLLTLVEGDLPSGRYRAADIPLSGAVATRESA